MTTLTQDPSSKPQALSGMIGFALGAAAMLIVLVSFVAGPFAPQQTIGISIGEIAAEAGKATLRSWLGLEQPSAQAATWTIDRALWVVGIVLGILATLCGAFAQIRRERRDIAAWAVGLGVTAVALQFFISAFLIIAGLLLVCVLITAIMGCLPIL